MRSDRILVCDPDAQVRRALNVILSKAGYSLQTATTGQEAVAEAQRDRLVAVILEVQLPDMDGIEVCRRLRQRVSTPIIVLSSVEDERTKIAAFVQGADDYLTKPFSRNELLARLAARLRTAPSPLRIETDGLVIDLTAHLVTRDGQEVHLTATEFTLLRVLVTSHGVVSHRTLTTHIWGSRSEAIPPRLRAHVANLRAKLDRGDRQSVILTEPGVGYRFAGDLVRPLRSDTGEVR
jgi:two-component system, OmpR family, KDP operon response regulator KdpE